MRSFIGGPLELSRIEVIRTKPDAHILTDANFSSFFCMVRKLSMLWVN